MLIVGFLTAAVTGYAAISMLKYLIREGRLRLFAYYTWVVGVLVLLAAYSRCLGGNRIRNGAANSERHVGNDGVLRPERLHSSG